MNDYSKNLSLIAAMDDDGLIGNGLKLPWPKLSEDLRRFKDLTMGRDLIMGRTTLDSFGKKNDGSPRLLSGRRHIVLSSQEREGSEQLLYAQSIDEALDIANEGAFVIGGAQVYEQLEPCCSTMYLTRIHDSFMGDTFFPKIDWSKWNIGVSQSYHDDTIPMTFEKYFR